MRLWLRFAGFGLLSLMASCTETASSPPEAGEATARESPPDSPGRPLELECAQITSIVTFDSMPDAPQRLEATYMGADHARWWFGSLAEGADLNRRLRHRSGDQVFGTEIGSSKSTVFDEKNAALVTLQLELRRAALLWPDSFHWAAEGDERSTPAANGSGTIRVELVGGEPVRFESRSPQGASYEALEVLGWREFGTRHAPAKLALSLDGQRLWTEEVVDFETNCHFASFYFLPADRRRTSQASATELDQRRHVDLAACIERRVPLEAETWSDAYDQVAALLARESTAIGGRAVGEFAFEVDEEVRPRALLLRLESAADPVPEGWSRRAAGPAVTVLVSSHKKLTAGRIRALRDGLPEGGPALPVYVRFARESPFERPAQLVIRVP